MATANIVGNIPEPDQLYGRDELIANLWRQIRNNNILLLAPRRFGKSGVMRHVLLRPSPGFLPVYLDLEDVDSPQEFVWRVTRELLSHDKLRECLQSARRLPAVFQDWITGTFEEAEFEGARVKFKDALAQDWHTAARRLLLEMEKARETLLFIFDELPAMLEAFGAVSDKQACDFLAWFRSVRLQQKDQLRRHRFVVGGSTGIDLILKRLAHTDKLNDFERLYVEPIQSDVAARLAQNLAKSLDIDLTPELVDQLLARIGPAVPYFIHLLFSQLAQLPAGQRKPLTAEVLDEVYTRRVLGPTCKHYFDYYRTRLRRYGDAGERSAIAMLRSVAEAPHGRASASALYDVYRKTRKRGASEQEFDELVADLECDWYLALDVRTNEYYFLVEVMRDWWLRWYGSRRRANQVRRRR